jgi:hypothetical protein
MEKTRELERFLNSVISIGGAHQITLIHDNRRAEATALVDGVTYPLCEGDCVKRFIEELQSKSIMTREYQGDDQAYQGVVAQFTVMERDAQRIQLRVERDYNLD